MVKTGRPKTDKPSSYTLRTRVDEDIYNQVQKYCNDNKISQSEFLRGLVEEKLVYKALERVEKKLMYQKDGKGSGTFKIPIPKKWVEKMEFTESDRTLKMSYDEGSKKIIIKKIK